MTDNETLAEDDPYLRHLTSLQFDAETMRTSSRQASADGGELFWLGVRTGLQQAIAFYGEPDSWENFEPWFDKPTTD